MIIEGKVVSSSQDKNGITTLKIYTRDIDDHICWVGEEIKLMKREYELKEIKEEIDWTGYDEKEVIK